MKQHEQKSMVTTRIASQIFGYFWMMDGYPKLISIVTHCSSNWWFRINMQTLDPQKMPPEFHSVPHTNMLRSPQPARQSRKWTYTLRSSLSNDWVRSVFQNIKPRNARTKSYKINTISRISMCTSVSWLIHAILSEHTPPRLQFPEFFPHMGRLNSVWKAVKKRPPNCHQKMLVQKIIRFFGFIRFDLTSFLAFVFPIMDGWFLSTCQPCLQTCEFPRAKNHPNQSLHCHCQGQNMKLCGSPVSGKSMSQTRSSN